MRVRADTGIASHNQIHHFIQPPDPFEATKTLPYGISPCTIELITIIALLPRYHTSLVSTHRQPANYLTVAYPPDCSYVADLDMPARQPQTRML
jgi:hypothetical protein